MKSYIALFRGVNVSGKNRMPMAELRTLLDSLGATSIKTYLQSGNAVFTHRESNRPRLRTLIQSAVQENFGFDANLILLLPSELSEAVAGNPFASATVVPTSVHLSVLESAPPKPDLEALRRLKAPTEQFALQDRYFYLHAPEGVGNSRLAKGYEKALGVAATARNWRSVCGILELLR